MVAEAPPGLFRPVIGAKNPWGWAPRLHREPSERLLDL